MSVLISEKETKKIKRIIKELDALTLLQENESVIEGFYHIQIGNYLYYGLTTPKQLIIAYKKPLRKPDLFELIPFRQIKEISFVRERIRQLLYTNISALIGIPIICYIFLLVRNLATGFLDPLFFDVMIWALIIVSAITVPLGFYHYFKGENLIHVGIPGKRLTIRRRYGGYFKKYKITLFRTTEQDLRFQGQIGDLEDVFHMLQRYSEGTEV